MPSDIRVRRVYEAVSPDDGARVLVDRVWPRGLRKDAAHLDEWAKDAAPSTELRKWTGTTRPSSTSSAAATWTSSPAARSARNSACCARWPRPGP